MRRRVLVLTRDLIPIPGLPTSGGGLRAWGLGEALRGRGHDVVYSVPRASVPEGDEHDDLRRLAFEPGGLHTTLLRSEADVVVVEQWGLATYVEETTLPVVVDLHGSLVLENAFREHRSLTSNAAAKIKALRKADLVLCPGLRQRAYFMAWMMMSGADPRAIPIEVLPVSMPPEPPDRAADQEGPLRLVYGGQLWPWIEPEAALQAASEVLAEQEGAGALHLFVEEPRPPEVLPHDASTVVNARPLSAGLRESPVVKLEGMIPREELLERYRGAHLAVDVYARNSERELAYTTRTVEYMWCGLPVLYGDYGELAGLIREYEAGWTVPPGDGDAIREAVREALGDRAELARRGDNARRLVQERLSWDRTIEPLDRFVRDPVVRDKGRTIFGKLSLEFDRISAENAERIARLEQDNERLVREVAARTARTDELEDALERQQRRHTEALAVRDNRIAELSDELARQDRRHGEAVERHGRETADLDRELRKMREEAAAAARDQEELEQELEQVKELLQGEQDQHAATSARYERARNELVMAQRDLEGRDQEVEQGRADLKAAVEQLEQQKEEFEGRIVALEQQLRAAAQEALDLKTDLAGQVAHEESIKGQRERARRENERLQQRIAGLQRNIHQLKDNWLLRTAETSQHGWTRVAVQVPALAGLFMRNLANNAYMTVWQKRHKVRIFPGQ